MMRFQGWRAEAALTPGYSLLPFQGIYEPVATAPGSDAATLENVWSLFKRSVIGSYHQVSAKHLDRYLDEIEFRFNNRNNPYLFRETLLRLLQTSNLEYKNLTSDKAA